MSIHNFLLIFTNINYIYLFNCIEPRRVLQTMQLVTTIIYFLKQKHWFSHFKQHFFYFFQLETFI
uniref:Uncharacterized protein n=1 Tax=Rhizophora mucronata TaxID=61149 RepID=A0A2P2MUH3_RHIMU